MRRIDADAARATAVKQAVAERLPFHPVTLASSFAFLALVPLDSFGQIAFALAAGVLIDTFIVRSWSRR
ncbi:MAG: MMPL family transporter [Actinomycetota bacterium]